MDENIAAASHPSRVVFDFYDRLIDDDLGAFLGLSTCPGSSIARPGFIAILLGRPVAYGSEVPLTAVGSCLKLVA